MVRMLTAVAAMLGVLATTSLARAQARELGTPGEFIISADRLVPLFAYTRVDEQADPTANSSTTTTQTSISLLWGENTQQELFYTVPRAGFDYVILPNVTVGGDLALYFSLGSGTSTKTVEPTTTTTTSGGNGGVVLFGLAPRGGYILRMNHLLSFWFRGGISFYTLVQNTAKLNAAGAFDRFSTDEFGLDFEPQVVFTPVPHFGLTAGPTLDIHLSGQHKETEFNGTGGSTSAS
ncbi:MAG TPA: hypothetical protein VEK07_01805, partial [Polyangiaceae bacterium]|nr:hypothetical protein [Polyangiaceae bacterium]